MASLLDGFTAHQNLVLKKIAELGSRIDLMPKIRWATVTQASPLRVQMDGDAEPLTITPQTVVRGLSVGARVVCVEQHRRVLVVAGNGVARFMAQAASTGRVYLGTTDTATGSGGTYIAIAPASDSIVNALWVNHDGTEILRLRKDGHIDSPHGPYAVAGGRGVSTPSSGVATVTFPAGRFSVPPILSVTSTSGGILIVTASTTTQFTVRQANTTGAQVAGTIDWTATQMTPTTANG